MLKDLVIKPTLSCTANCSICVYNKDMFDPRQPVVLFDDWISILDEAGKLGVQKFHISGGEPLLIPYTPDLILYGKSKNWHVNLNTNGALVDDKMVKALVDSGLDSVTISLYGSSDETHDSIKRAPESWNMAVQAISAFARTKIEVRVNYILTSISYEELPTVISLCHRLGADGISVSYLEGDKDRGLMLNENDIRRFRKEILPEAFQQCTSLPLGIKNKAKNVVSRLFDDSLDIQDWADGRYRPNGGSCDIPQHFTILLDDGDVIPCYMAEFTRDRMMGNLQKDSLQDTWNSNDWKEFRRAGYYMCERCPIHLHSWIPLKGLFGKISDMLGMKK